MYSGSTEFRYNTVFISRYLRELSFWRRFKARFLGKKCTKEEYDKWFDEVIVIELLTNSSQEN